MPKLKVGSTFSGVGGFDLGLELTGGFEVVWQIELDSYRRRVLQRHWPKVPQHVDIQTVKGAELEPIDLLCGGFPCQDISIAGHRAGLSGSRSGLFFEFARLAKELRPSWVLIENVRGLFSSNQGQDFQTILNTLGEIGYGVAWRLFDSQFFGVPQRRQRVYIVGFLGGPCPSSVLFNSEGSQRNPAEECGDGQASPPLAQASPGECGNGDTKGFISSPKADTHGVRKAPGIPGRVDALAFAENQRSELRLSPHIPALSKGGGKLGMSYPAVLLRMRQGKPGGGKGPLVSPDKSLTLATGNDQILFQDGSLEDPLDSRDTPPDGRRYAAMGDAVSVPVIRWIGEQILKTEEEALA